MDGKSSSNTSQIKLTAECCAWFDKASDEEIMAAKEIGYQAMKISGMLKPKSYILVEPGVNDRISVVKGQIGEAHVESILRKHFGNNVENVTKTSKSGDLTLNFMHKKLIVEVKNYKNDVPSSEVEKFQRDLATTNASCGVFISLNSQISTIREDFIIRYENIESRVVPAIYMVSNEEKAIVSAVNIVSQLVKATDVLINDIYSRDKVLELTYEASEALDNFARSRNDLQTNIGAVTTILNKTTVGFIGAEVTLRKAVDGIKSELYGNKVIAGGEIETELSRILDEKGYKPQTRLHIAKIVSAVEFTIPKHNLTISSWKNSARKYTHIQSGISLNFLQSKVQVNIPRNKVSWNNIQELLTTKKASVDDNVNADLDEQTVTIIEKIILGLQNQE
jgi:hypothetical protein